MNRYKQYRSSCPQIAIVKGLKYKLKLKLLEISKIRDSTHKIY